MAGLSADALESFQDDLPVGLVLCDPDGLVLSANARVADWLGKSVSEVEGHLHLPDLFTVGSKIYLETHVSPLLRMQQAVREVAMEVAGPQPRPVLLNADYFPTAHGPRIRLLMVDIRERRRYERELRRERERAEASEAHLRVLAEAAQRLPRSLEVEATAAAVADLAVEHFADACFVHLRGQSGLELVASALAPHAPPPLDRLDVGKLVDLEQAVEGQAPIVDPELTPSRAAAAGVADGALSPHPWGFACVPLPAGDLEGCVSFVWSGIDAAPPGTLLQDYAGVASLALCNAQAHERARAAVRSREELMGILAHEFGNPLSTLRIQVEAWRRRVEGSPDAAHVQRMMESVQRQLDRMSRIVADMLDLSRIRAGRLSLALARTDVGRLVQDVAQRQQPQFTIRGTTLHVEAEDGVDAVCDAMRLEQALVNLLSNAAKYGQGRPATVRLRADERILRIEVADRGLGVPPAERERVFGRFERLEGTSEPGAGLGLYIVRHLVGAHGGRIWVEDTPGGGATFVVELPRQGPDARVDAARLT
ncbi:MAG TPA: PAS domain-containing sensor histidine kinase [Candidatus Thermoplasmatota archaeon]|nr:PAS domain-containing sensor histidine kinase [Candidatus Thermoplasmatota archaeon]